MALTQILGLLLLLAGPARAAPNAADAASAARAGTAAAWSDRLARLDTFVVDGRPLPNLLGPVLSHTYELPPVQVRRLPQGLPRGPRRRGARGPALLAACNDAARYTAAPPHPAAAMRWAPTARCALSSHIAPCSITCFCTTCAPLTRLPPMTLPAGGKVARAPGRQPAPAPRRKGPAPGQARQGRRRGRKHLLGVYGEQDWRN